jgi:ribosomal protein S18 acetylase RimI-like enzyme
MIMRRYQKSDQDAIMRLIESEGSEWSDYFLGNGKESYLDALLHSITLVMPEGHEIIGYLRAKEDFGFGIYIYDLLVSRDHRGQGFGEKLIQHLVSCYPEQSIYVMSDVDLYYEKLGYKRIGSIFQIQ